MNIFRKILYVACAAGFLFGSTQAMINNQTNAKSSLNLTILLDHENFKSKEKIEGNEASIPSAAKTLLQVKSTMILTNADLLCVPISEKESLSTIVENWNVFYIPETPFFLLIQKTYWNQKEKSIKNIFNIESFDKDGLNYLTKLSLKELDKLERTTMGHHLLDPTMRKQLNEQSKKQFLSFLNAIFKTTEETSQEKTNLNIAIDGHRVHNPGEYDNNFFLCGVPSSTMLEMLSFFNTNKAFNTNNVFLVTCGISRYKSLITNKGPYSFNIFIPGVNGAPSYGYAGINIIYFFYCTHNYQNNFNRLQKEFAKSMISLSKANTTKKSNTLRLSHILQYLKAGEKDFTLTLPDGTLHLKNGEMKGSAHLNKHNNTLTINNQESVLLLDGPKFKNYIVAPTRAGEHESCEIDIINDASNNYLKKKVSPLVFKHFPNYLELNNQIKSTTLEKSETYEKTYPSFVFLNTSKKFEAQSIEIINVKKHAQNKNGILKFLTDAFISHICEDGLGNLKENEHLTISIKKLTGPNDLSTMLELSRHKDLPINNGRKQPESSLEKELDLQCYDSYLPITLENVLLEISQKKIQKEIRISFDIDFLFEESSERWEYIPNEKSQPWNFQEVKA